MNPDSVSRRWHALPFDHDFPTMVFTATVERENGIRTEEFDFHV